MDFRSQKVKPKTGSPFLFFVIMIHIYDSSKGFRNPGRRTEKIEGDMRVKGGGRYASYGAYTVYIRERRKGHDTACRQKHKIVESKREGLSRG